MAIFVARNQTSSRRLAMTDIHTLTYQSARWHELPIVQRNRAVEFLAEKLREDETGFADLKARIAEKPYGAWLMGRDDAPCFMCRGTGVVYNLKPEIRERLDAERQRLHPGLITRDDMNLLDATRKDPANCLPPVTCDVCGGTGRHAEMPFHHGWGTGIRNLLRQNGFAETEMGIDNWDDYYAVVVEKAVTGG
jgi:hypothetical protein